MKGKKIITTVMASMLCASSVLGVTACKGSGATEDLRFWFYGDAEEIEVYTAMTEEFNRTYGKEHGINVVPSMKPPAGYDATIQTTVFSNSCPDVFLGVDDIFKRWVGMEVITDMNDYIYAVDDIVWDDIFDTAVDRLRYNPETNTSNATDHLYGLPLDSKPCALYYNETMFKDAGIVVISVDEKDLADFNAGKIADKRGKTLADYKKEYPQLEKLEKDIPAKGYFRSMFPYTVDAAWMYPDADEVLIFNNRIPMNWDEIEDLAMMMTPSYNSQATGYGKSFGASLEYGFFTEWWFNYGWSVGGDCLEDLTGNGDFNYSLLDSSSNYMVMKDGFVGAYTGKSYKAGETVEFLDKFNIPQGATMQADNNGGYTYNGASVGVASNVTTAVAEGVLHELPSTRDAFVRYLKLGAEKNASIEGEGGLNVSPNPIVFNTRTRSNYFYSGKMAMLVEYSQYMAVTSEQADKRGFEYDVAPLPVYKEYVDETDPYNGSCAVQGKYAGQSNSKSMFSCGNSKKKEKAAQFMVWMASKAGQTVRAEMGHFTNQKELLSEIKFKGYAPKNVSIFYENMEYQLPGDWWYLPDISWIQQWAVPLNSEVRNGNMSYTDWKAAAIPETNALLKEY